MAKTSNEVDPRITKKRVTMKNIALDPASGQTIEMSATDYVREDFLDAYVTAARQNWQYVEVSEEYDAGPGGYDGPTHVPDGIEHELAGQTFEANEGWEEGIDYSKAAPADEESK